MTGEPLADPTKPRILTTLVLDGVCTSQPCSHSHRPSCMPHLYCHNLLLVLEEGVCSEAAVSCEVSYRALEFLRRSL